MSDEWKKRATTAGNPPFIIHHSHSSLTTSGRRGPRRQPGSSPADHPPDGSSCAPGRHCWYCRRSRLQLVNTARGPAMSLFSTRRRENFSTLGNGFHRLRMCRSKAAGRAPHGRRLFVEALEDRRLLSIFADMGSLGMPGVENSSVAWGDYDSDGKLDILLTGITGLGTRSRGLSQSCVDGRQGPRCPYGTCRRATVSNLREALLGSPHRRPDPGQRPELRSPRRHGARGKRCRWSHGRREHG